MKKIIMAFATVLTYVDVISQQSAVEVADNTLKVAAFGEEIFYYGFAEGDELIFNFCEEKGKEIKEVEITRWPDHAVYMDYKTKKIENKKIKINETGVYRFRFTNTGLGGRICKFSIHRIPAQEATKNFNSEVRWRMIYDTLKQIVPEHYLIKKEYNPVQVLEPSHFYINSGSNATFKGGKSRITVPVFLPKNTVEWYYTFSAFRDNDAVASTKSSLKLLGQLTTLLGGSIGLSIVTGMLTSPPGGNVCDIYLVDLGNGMRFTEKLDHKYFTEGSRENLSSGVVGVKNALFTNSYLGIRNPDGSHGINVVVEAVAITLSEEWGTRDVEKLNITSRREPYLGN